MAQDNEIKPVGLNRFDIKTIDFNGRLEDIALLDFNQDNLTDCLFTYHNKNSPEGRLAGILFQKPNGFPGQLNQIWRVPAETTGLVPGDFSEIPGNEVGCLDGHNLTAYTFQSVSGEPFFNPAPGKIAAIHSILNYPPENSLPLLPYASDMDNNALADLIIPQDDGYRIYFQSRKNSVPEFSSCLIPVSRRVELKKNNLSFLTITRTLPNFKILDFNGDGLKDMVTFQDGTFFYYLQTESADAEKRFSRQPNGQFTLKFLQTDTGQNELNAAEIIFTDIDQNGLPDLVIYSIRGKLEDFTALSTRILVWLTPPNADHLPKTAPVYPDTPTQIINLKGICPLLRVADVNSDGYLDLITSSFRTDIKANLRKAILHYVDLNYQVYFFRKTQGAFSKIADYDRKMNFPMELAGRGQKYFSHVYLHYDFDNDGRADLMRISGPDKKRGILTINKGHPRERLINPDDIGFEKDEYLLYPVRIPQQVLVEDLNRDHKKDIILVYRNRLIILTSK